MCNALVNLELPECNQRKSRHITNTFHLTLSSFQHTSCVLSCVFSQCSWLCFRSLLHTTITLRWLALVSATEFLQSRTPLLEGCCLNSISFSYLPSKHYSNFHTPLWDLTHEICFTLALTTNQQRIALPCPGQDNPQECTQSTAGFCFRDTEFRTWDTAQRQPPGIPPS